MTERQRIHFIDMARGIGIILVVLGHILSPWDKPFNGNDVLRDYIYSFHMALFFIISGVLIYNAVSGKELTIEYLKGKILSLTKKLLVPYFLWSCIYFVLSHTTLSGKSDVIEWIICIVTFRGRAPIWFLGALFWSEVAAFIIIYYTKQSKKHFCIIMFIITITVVVSSMIYHPETIKSVFIDYVIVSVFRGFMCLFFILVGYMIAGVLLQKIHHIYKLILGILMSFGSSVLLNIVFSIKCNFHTYNIKNVYAYLLSGIAGALFVLLICKLINSFIRVKTLELIGKNTMGIMCLHYIPMPFIPYSASICSYVGITGAKAFLFTFCFVLGGSLICTLILKKFRLVY